MTSTDTPTWETWEKVHAPIAARAGWDIFDADTDGFGEWQIQRDDDACLFCNDEQVWALVMAGDCPTTQYARRLIAEKSPVEFARMLSHHYGWPL